MKFDVEKAQQMLDVGKSVSEICMLFDCTHFTFNRYVNSNQLKLKSQNAICSVCGYEVECPVGSAPQLVFCSLDCQLASAVSKQKNPTLVQRIRSQKKVLENYVSTKLGIHISPNQKIVFKRGGIIDYGGKVKLQNIKIVNHKGVESGASC